MRVTFYTKKFNELVIQIEAEELTGEVLSSYFENYFGLDSTLTLRHRQSNRTFNIGLYNTGYNQFEGVYPLTMLPFGLYRLEGRVRDIMNNYALLSAFHIDTGEPVQPIEMLLEPGYNVVPIISAEGLFQDRLDLSGIYGKIIHAEAAYCEITSAGRYDLMISMKGRYERELGGTHV